MHDALILLSELDNNQIEWIFETGFPQKFRANTPIIREGIEPDALYFVMEGLVGIYVSSFGDKCLTKLGPGEVLGDISFLEKVPASASVVAIEESHLLVIPRNLLESRLKDDPDFSVRLYKTFAIIACKRLRKRERSLGLMLKTGTIVNIASTPTGERLIPIIEKFKRNMQNADKAALKNNNIIPENLVINIEEEFTTFWELINTEIGDKSAENIDIKKELGEYLQREILPYLLLTKTAERIYSKPRGYAGDFLTIEWIYQNKPEGTGRMGPLLDRCFLNLPAPKAVRNRRGMMAQKMRNIIKEKNGSQVKITGLGCGPAEEIFDVLDQLVDKSIVSATLIDIDLQALAFVGDKMEKKKLNNYIKLINGNLVYLAVGRHKITLQDQDLVYSIGLIDYFHDKFVISLLNFVYGLLRPGGKAIFGNFHSDNPNKAGMDYLLDWRLIHRTEEDMNRLFTSSAFGKSYTDICFEDEKLILFTSCIKE